MSEILDLSDGDYLEGLWGDIEDYYPQEEIDKEKKIAWMTSRQDWIMAIMSLDFVTAEAIESEWGDAPSTRSIKLRLQEIL